MEKTVKKVSALDFFCIGFGAIVGVGWAVSINNWMIGSGGPLPASIGYLAAMIMMIPIALTYCELVPMFPEAGGGMVYAHKAFGRTVALFSGWAAFGAFVAIIPWEAIQITSMLGYLIPGLTAGTPLYTLYGTDIYLSTILIGTAFSLLLYLLNRRGLAAAARVQKILCLLLVGSAVVARRSRPVRRRGRKSEAPLRKGFSGELPPSFLRRGAGHSGHGAVLSFRF